MASNRRPPPSCLWTAIVAVGADGQPLPPEQAWLRSDVARRFAAADLAWHAKYGFALPLAGAGRSPERAFELRGCIDLHVVGSAVDVSFRRVLEEFRARNLPEATYDDRALATILDPVLSRAGFWPLGASRFPEPPAKPDPNHYSTCDVGARQQFGPQVVPNGLADLVYAMWTPLPEPELRRLFPRIFGA